MNLTPELIAAFAAAIVALLTAIGAFLVQWQTAAALREVNVKQDVTLTQQAQQTVKLEEVHQLTNSRLGRIEEQLKAAQEELKHSLASAVAAESTRMALALATETANTVAETVRANAETARANAEMARDELPPAAEPPQP